MKLSVGNFPGELSARMKLFVGRMFHGGGRQISGIRKRGSRLSKIVLLATHLGPSEKKVVLEWGEMGRVVPSWGLRRV